MQKRFKILVTGSDGQLGNEIRHLTKNIENFEYIFKNRSELDITNEEMVREVLCDGNYDYCINCAAYTNVDKAEEDATSFLVNANGAKNIANACKDTDTFLIHISTDYVFNGKASKPYKEIDITDPINSYGSGKSWGEKYVVRSKCKYIILRTSWLYSTYGKNFPKTISEILENNGEVNVVYDQVGSPTYAKHLAKFIIYIIENDKKIEGIYHFSNTGCCSWFDFAKMITNNKNLNCVVNRCTSDFFKSKNKAERPNYSVLDTTTTEIVFDYKIPYWIDALNEWKNDMIYFNIINKKPLK